LPPGPRRRAPPRSPPARVRAIRSASREAHGLTGPQPGRGTSNVPLARHSRRPAGDGHCAPTRPRSRAETEHPPRRRGRHGLDGPRELRERDRDAEPRPTRGARCAVHRLPRLGELLSHPVDAPLRDGQPPRRPPRTR
jgi:hypothetical protein